MKRWHAERNLMLRRWRQRLAMVSDGYSHMALAPPSEAPGRWERHQKGIGAHRSRKPLDCGHPRCGCCHGEKFYAPKARAAKRRAAIEYDRDA